MGASNRDYQVLMVEKGCLRPLVSMMSVNAEPRHYAGLALLKLADNFNNHIKIAEEGGIQALLRLARARSTDEELQYKAALTVGNLASNAVKLLPRRGAGPEGSFGAAAASASAATIKKSKDATTEYLDSSANENAGGGK